MKNLSPRNDLIVPSKIRTMFNLVGTKANTINLVLGEPDFITPKNIIDYSYKAMCDGFTHYTHNSGILELREVISQKLKQETGIEYTAKDEIIITAGGQEALYLACQVILEYGDEVIIADPYYPPYINEIALAGGTPVFVQVKESDGFAFTIEGLRKKITSKTKAILINSPANPTGGMIPVETLKGIADLAQIHDLYVISDEVYQYFIYEGKPYTSIVSFPGMKERTILIDSLSKSYAMTGWRVGFAACNNSIYDKLMYMQENVMTHISTSAQYAAIEAYTGDQASLEEMITEYRARRDMVVSRLNEMPGISCSNPKGAFYAFVNIKATGMTSEQFAYDLFDKTNTLVVPGSGFGMGGEGYIRISYATSREILAEGLERMNSYLKGKEFS